MRPLSHHLRRSVAGALLFMICPLPAGAQFEGIVESRNRSADEWGKLQAFDMTIWVKGNKAKVRMTGSAGVPASTIISRGDRNLVWVLNEDARTYIEVRRVDEERSRAEGELKPTVRNTGRTRKILGYTAEQLYLIDGEAETEIWGTRELRQLQESLASGLAGAGSAPEGGHQSELAALGLFPLVARTRLKGVVLESSEVTKIEPRVVSPDQFELPAGFRKEGMH